MANRPWGHWLPAVALVAAYVPNLAAGAVPMLGQQAQWKTSLRAELGQAGAQPTVVSLSGDWSRTVVAVRANAYDVRFQLSSARLEGNRGGQVDPNELRLAQERLSRPFWVTCGADGSLLSAHFPKEMAPSDQNLLQTIATETQFVQADPSLPIWTSSERDGGGSYLAIYQRQDATHFRKKKLKYLDADPQVSGSLAFTIEESEVDFTFAADGVIAAVNGVQQIRLSVPGTTGNSLVTRFEVHLSELRSSVETTLTGMTLPRGLEEVPIATQQVSARVAQEDMDTRLLTGKSTDSILSASTASSIENDLRLAALFRRRPESVPLAVTRLTAGGAGSQAIAGALAEANTPASVQALRKVAQDPARVTAVRVSSLGALAGMKEPSVEAMQIPVVLFGDRNPQVRNAARLAGGALARAGRETHGVESDAIEVDLAGRFGRAATLDEKKELLSALGNSAGPRAATVLAAAMKDPREDVRTSATRSLRLIPGASTDGLLAEIAKADSSATVRGAALFAISFRVPLTVTLWDAVLEAARSDASASVRNQAISLLRSDPRRPPETETTLAWIAQHDPEPVFRRLANDALAAIRSSPAVR